MDVDALVNGLIWGGGILAGLLAFTAFIRTFLIIGRPNELVVISGREYTLDNGERVGFRRIRGGRALRIPIFERVDRMDMTVMPIDIKIRNAYAKGNILINVDAVANAKVTSDENAIHHAVERFLGKARAEMRQVVKETLEGTLRGVIAQLTPEEINNDRQKLAENLKREVTDDLGRMGLQVDTFKIQHISDDVNYLDSIGRIRTAEVLRDAQIAEQNALREAEQAIAAAESRGVVAQEQSAASVAEKDNDMKRIAAELEAQARSEEERTQGAGREARARALQKLQKIRSVLEELRLHAEEVLPAEGERKAQELRAAGDAAIKKETGRAQAEALSALHGAWRAAGDHAHEIFLVQQIDSILAQVARATESLEVRHVNLIDGGDGRALARYIGGYPAVVSEILARITETIGIDVPAILGASALTRPASTDTTTSP